MNNHLIPFEEQDPFPPPDNAARARHSIYEIDEEVGGGDVGRALVSLTGQKTVPNIFIGQKVCRQVPHAPHEHPNLSASALVPNPKLERNPSQDYRNAY